MLIGPKVFNDNGFIMVDIVIWMREVVRLEVIKSLLKVIYYNEVDEEEHIRFLLSVP
jgi:hypothetical protein